MFSCPIPHTDSDRITMACGGGGQMMNRLIEEIFLSAFGTFPSDLHDSALCPVSGDKIAMTTDSFVVNPLIFPGGDIGSLSVHGTVNDLAMSGAKPLYLSAGFILEEGLEIKTLQTIVRSMAHAAKEAGVRIVTGDTKVVEKGKGDGIYINTCGVGAPQYKGMIAPCSIQEGDIILLSGDIGRHGMTIMSMREGLEFDSDLTSDSAALWPSVDALIRSGACIHCLRDVTRGGLTTTLHELAGASGFSFELDEALIPVRHDVRSACEMLGLDPMQVACEGRYIIIVPQESQEQALAALRSVEVSQEAKTIGVVRASGPTLSMKNVLGVKRILSMPSGAQLPRIC